MATATKRRAHYSEATFVETARTNYDNGTFSRHGYCRTCCADMSIYNRSGGVVNGLRHYSSHQTAKSLGLWGKR